MLGGILSAKKLSVARALMADVEDDTRR